MAVFKINKTRDYTVMSNHHLKDKNLSLRGKGLLSVGGIGFVLSCPELEGLISPSLEVTWLEQEITDNGSNDVPNKIVVPNKNFVFIIKLLYLGFI